MRKLYVIALLLPFVFSCNSDGNGLYGPPDAFDWDFDLGVFNGDVDMYIDGVYDSTYESNTMSVASYWQPDTDWGTNPFLPDCSSSNFVILNDFINSCGILDGEVFTIFNNDNYYPIYDESTDSIFWGEKYGGGTFDNKEIQIEFYEVARNLDMDEIVSIKMWTGSLTKVD
jgi:hypothetical protein